MDDDPEQVEYQPTKYVNWEHEHMGIGVVCWCGRGIDTAEQKRIYRE